VNHRRIWLGAAALLLACGTKTTTEPGATSPDGEGSFSEAASKGRLTVVYTNNLDGEIEPCG
jgi:hypothetical protein